MQSQDGKQIKAKPSNSAVGESGVGAEAQISKATSADASRTHNIQVTAQWSAPLPPPEALARYDEIHPGSAKTIFALFEKETLHRQSIDLSEQSRKEQADNILQGAFTRGQNYGLVLSLVCVAAALGSVVLGAPWIVSVALVGIPMVSAVKSFLHRS